MSLFLGYSGAASTFNQIYMIASDDRHQEDRQFIAGGAGGLPLKTTNIFMDGFLWTTSRGMGGSFNGGMQVTGDASSQSYSYEPYIGFDDSGGQQNKKIIGQTLNSVGGALGSCTIRGFLTATNAFVNQVTSDSGGYYELPTPYVGQQHYLVAYQPGSPDVAGTSIDELTPA